MKIIFSRKGFDSAAGGVASPILPDGTMLPLPIPDPQSPIRYSQIRLYGHDIGQVVSDLTKGRTGAHHRAHLDPDLVPGALKRKRGWKPIFGQTGGDQTVLGRASVGPGDLFLFFGWYRRASMDNGIYKFARGAPDIHVIWGWMQIESLINVAADTPPSWADYHPHVAAPMGRINNTLYIGQGGTFRRFGETLQLTAPGRSRSIWRLPAFFNLRNKIPPLGYHGDQQRWTRDGDYSLLKTVGRGQEFVLDVQHYPEVAGWADNLLRKNV